MVSAMDTIIKDGRIFDVRDSRYESWLDTSLLLVASMAQMFILGSHLFMYNDNSCHLHAQQRRSRLPHGVALSTANASSPPVSGGYLRKTQITICNHSQVMSSDGQDSTSAIIR